MFEFLPATLPAVHHKPCKNARIWALATIIYFFSDFIKHHTTVNKHTSRCHPVVLRHDPKITKHGT
jgi:hypothetical protein